jgi:hypothetical protein
VKAHAKPGSVTKLACAAELESNPKAKALPGVAYFSYAELDETKTKEARADAGKPGTCCYTMHRLCGGGRPLVHGDVAHVAALRPGDAWHTELAMEPCDALAEDERRALGERWLRDARMEHASVASFARAALELMAVGAPPELVADCHRAALDEVRHAQACFTVASRLLGRTIDPGRLEMPPIRACTLIDVACTTLIEGCIGETASALIATRAAHDCEDEGLREVLERIADDETGHAALAFRIVRWCIAQGGADVTRAVHVAMERARAETPDESLHHVVGPLLACL